MANSYLRVRAIVIDTVIHVSTKMRKAQRRQEEIRRIVTLWRAIAPQAARYSGPHSSRALLKVLSQGMYDGDRKGYGESLVAFAQRLQSDGEHPYTNDGDARRVIRMLSRFSLTPWDMKSSKDLQS